MPEFWINMGPQHPMTHGLWNMKVQVDGETVTDARPELGYLHRGVEKISEVREFQKVIVLTDRLCYVSSITWSQSTFSNYRSPVVKNGLKRQSGSAGSP